MNPTAHPPQMAACDVQAVQQVFDMLLQHAQGHLSVFHQLCAKLRFALTWCNANRLTLSTLLRAARAITPSSLPAVVEVLGKAAECDSWEGVKEIQGLLKQVQHPPRAPIDLLSTSPPPDLTARAADLAHCAPDLADTAISPQKKRPLATTCAEEDMHRRIRQRQALAATERRNQATAALSQGLYVM